MQSSVDDASKEKSASEKADIRIRYSATLLNGPRGQVWLDFKIVTIIFKWQKFNILPINTEIQIYTDSTRGLTIFF